MVRLRNVACGLHTTAAQAGLRPPSSTRGTSAVAVAVPFGCRRLVGAPAAGLAVGGSRVVLDIYLPRERRRQSPAGPWLRNWTVLETARRALRAVAPNVHLWEYPALRILETSVRCSGWSLRRRVCRRAAARPRGLRHQKFDWACRARGGRSALPLGIVIRRVLDSGMPSVLCTRRTALRWLGRGTLQRVVAARRGGRIQPSNSDLKGAGLPNTVVVGDGDSHHLRINRSQRDD